MTHLLSISSYKHCCWTRDPFLVRVTLMIDAVVRLPEVSGYAGDSHCKFRAVHVLNALRSGHMSSRVSKKSMPYYEWRLHCRQRRYPIRIRFVSVFPVMPYDYHRINHISKRDNSPPFKIWRREKKKTPDAECIISREQTPLGLSIPPVT